MRDALTITPTMLRQFRMCERLAWLEQSDEPLAPILFVRSLPQDEDELPGHVGEALEVGSWEQGVEATRALMEQGVDVILGAYLERTAAFDGIALPVRLRGRVDRLVRRRSLVRALAPVYRPAEIQHYAADDDPLALDAAVWMLQAVQHADVSGMIWLGERAPGIPEARADHDYDPQRLLDWIAQLANTLLQRAAPPVRLEDHCETCRWYADCRRAVEPQLPISLLSGISRQARQHLIASGITTLRQIADMQPDDLRRFKGIKTSAPAIHANARAYVEGEPIWFSPLPSASAQMGIMFDLETDPFTGRPWSWGWCDVDGHAQMIITAHREEEVRLPDGRVVITVRDSDAAWRLFTALNPNPQEAVYHWTGFDAGVMRATAPADVRQQLEPRMCDLHHTYKSCVRFPVDGASLKVVARYLDFEWAEYDAWDACYRDYRHWLASGDLAALSRACSYQQDDVKALAVVWKWLVTESS